MRNFNNILHLLGGLIFLMGLSMCVPLLVALIYGGEAAAAIFEAAALTMAVGAGLWLATKVEGEITVRQSFAVVGVGWLVLAAFGALPFWFWGERQFADFSNCYFETISGLTTTGATILGGTDPLEKIATLPKGLLFWRSLTHWLGGMGIIVLAIALLPLLGHGVMQLFKAEVPGPTADKLSPRVKETAKSLWIVYAALTGMEVVLLWLGPMNLFDSLCHAFGTMATGGFSTKDESIGFYPDPYTQWVIIVFMVLAGTNFTLHYHLLRRGRVKTYWASDEFRVYFGILIGASLPIALLLHAVDPTLTAERALRDACFQVSSIVTTTGYGSADYELWPQVAQVIIFLLMFVGGCAGSTGGGVKVVRHVLLTRTILAEFKRMLHPRAVIPIRLNQHPVSKNVLASVHAFALLYMLLIGFGAILLAMQPADPRQPIDVLTSLSVSLSCISNVGPAFGLAGPTENYAFLSDTGKWICSLLMVAGRLELYTVVVLLTPAFWRRH